MQLNASLETEVTLRAKNQFTLPEQIARKLGVRKGDKFIITVDENNPDVIQIRRLRESYYGSAAGA